MMEMNQTQYQAYVGSIAQPSPIAKNMAWAFCVGGSICAASEVLREYYLYGLGLEEKVAGAALSLTLIALSTLLTGLGLYHKLAKHAGAGTLVPITGFANSMVSPAIEFKAEGYLLGVGGKMFVVAGPVLVYGTTASVLYGLLYWFVTQVL